MIVKDFKRNVLSETIGSLQQHPDGTWWISQKYNENKILIDWRNLMSDTYYGLSKMEYNLMKYFWNTNAPVSFSEVVK